MSRFKITNLAQKVADATKKLDEQKAAVALVADVDPMDTFKDYIELSMKVDFGWFNHAMVLPEKAYKAIDAATTIRSYLDLPVNKELKTTSTIDLATYGDLRVTTFLKYVKKAGFTGIPADNWNQAFYAIAAHGQVEFSAWCYGNVGAVYYKVEKANYGSCAISGNFGTSMWLSRALFMSKDDITPLVFPKALAKVLGKNDGTSVGEAAANVIVENIVHNTPFATLPRPHLNHYLRFLDEETMDELRGLITFDPSNVLNMNNANKSIFSNQTGLYGDLFKSVAVSDGFPLDPARVLAAFDFKAYVGELSDIVVWLRTPKILKVSTQRPSHIPHTHIPEVGPGTAFPNDACLYQPTPVGVVEYMALASPAAIVFPVTSIYDMRKSLEPLVAESYHGELFITFSTLPLLVIKLFKDPTETSLPVSAISKRYQTLELSIMEKVLIRYKSLIAGEELGHPILAMPKIAGKIAADIVFGVKYAKDLNIPYLRMYPAVSSDAERKKYVATRFNKGDMKVYDLDAGESYSPMETKEKQKVKIRSAPNPRTSLPCRLPHLDSPIKVGTYYALSASGKKLEQVELPPDMVCLPYDINMRAIITKLPAARLNALGAVKLPDKDDAAMPAADATADGATTMPARDEGLVPEVLTGKRKYVDVVKEEMVDE